MLCFNMKNIYSNIITIVCVFIFQTTLHAKIYHYSLLELSEMADLTLIGQVEIVKEKSADVSVSSVLSGRFSEEKISVSPIYSHHCKGESINFKNGENVLLFLKVNPKGNLEVPAGGQGKIQLTDANRNNYISAAKLLIEINTQNEVGKYTALYKEAKNPNPLIHSSVIHYFSLPQSQREAVDFSTYKTNMISLINDPNPYAQETGLRAIYRNIKDDSLIPRLIELTQSEVFSVVISAMSNLEQYNTDASSNAFIELTKHKNESIQMGAIRSLLKSKRPEARLAVENLKQSNNDRIRSYATDCLKKY